MMPTGRLMNRFSKDMDELDVRLPFHAENFLQQVFMVVFILVTLAAVSCCPFSPGRPGCRLLYSFTVG